MSSWSRVLVAALWTAPLFAASPPRLDTAGDPLPDGAIARFGTTRCSCPWPVEMLAFSRDGKRLFGGSKDGEKLRAWDTATGRVIALREPDKPGRVFATVAPDGRFLYLGAEPCCRLWDPLNGRASDLWDLREHSAYLAGYSPDGKLLAVALNEDVVVLLEPTTGKELGRIPLLGGATVQQLVFAQDNRLLAVAMQGGHVWLWDCQRKKRVRWYHTGGKGKDIPIIAVAFSPDGRGVAVSSNIGDKLLVQRFEMDSDSEADGFTPPEAPIALLRFSADSKTLLGVSVKGNLHQWNALTGKEIRKLGDVEEDADAFAIDPAGQTVAMARGGCVHLVDVPTGKPRLPFQPLPPLVSVTFAGKTEAACFDEQGTLHFWDVETGRPGRSLPLPEIKEVAAKGVLPSLSADGRLLASWGEDLKPFRIADARTGKTLWSGPESAEGHGVLAFAPDGRRFVVVAPTGKTLEVWDVAGRRKWRTLALGEVRQPLRLAWSPDGRSVAGVTEGEGFIWEVETEQLRHRFHPRAPTGLAFLRDGRLAMGSGAARVSLIRPGSNEIEAVGLTEPSTCIAASPDGRWLAAGVEEGRVVLHELSSGKQHVLRGHKAPVRGVAFAPASSRLVSSSEDGTALVWDLKALPETRPAVRTAPLETCWESLASLNAARAARARATFEVLPTEAVKLMTDRLRPVAPLPAERVGDLLRKLDSPTFAVREKARAELESLGDQVEAALRRALRQAEGLELKRRLEGLIEKIERPLTGGETLRAVRAVEVLESIATPEARALLESLARGDPAARLTREARSAIERLRD